MRTPVLSKSTLVLLLLVSVTANIGLGLFAYKAAITGQVLGADVSPEILLTKLEDLIELPLERPTIAEIEDNQPLISRNKTFYEKSQRGDFLFVYSDRAIIYRPSVHKIVNFTSFDRLSSPTPL